MPGVDSYEMRFAKQTAGGPRWLIDRRAALS